MSRTTGRGVIKTAYWEMKYKATYMGNREIRDSQQWLVEDLRRNFRTQYIVHTAKKDTREGVSSTKDDQYGCELKTRVGSLVNQTKCI